MAFAAGTFEFIFLSGRPVEAVTGLAQRRPLQTWLGLVVNRKRFVPVRASPNWRNFHLGNLAHCTADRFPDLAEGVQVLKCYRALFYLSRLAHSRKGGAGEQL